MTRKQRKKLLLLGWFAHDRDRLGGGMGTKHDGIIESPSGVDSEEAFMEYQSNGVKPESVKDLVRYIQLVEAQRSMAMMEKMWREDLGKIITIGELKERDDSFVSDEQYDEFCMWVDRVFGGVPQYTILEDSVKDALRLFLSDYYNRKK